MEGAMDAMQKRFEQLEREKRELEGAAQRQPRRQPQTFIPSSTTLQGMLHLTATLYRIVTTNPYIKHNFV